jgi:hypothetical protein
MDDNVINNIKIKVIEAKDNTIKFLNQHKYEIVIRVILTGGAIFFGYKYFTAKTTIIEKDSVIKYKNKIIDSYAKENSNLSSQLKIKDLIINDCYDEIDYLKELCNKKDEIFDLTMSDGFRHGSQECARQMAYKRWEA